MATTKMYGVNGVNATLELGKDGYIVQYDSGNGLVEILQSDGSTLGRLQIAEPTANSDATTKLYVDTQINNLVDAAPGTLDTLNEIAAALNDDPDFYTTITNMINLKADQTTVDEIDANADDLIALTGVAENSTNLGTGHTYIGDNSTIIAAFGDIESQIQTNENAIANMDRGCRHGTVTKDSTSPADIGASTIPSGRVIKEVVVNVTEAWGAGATMEIGHSGDTDLWAASSEIDLTAVDQYVIRPLYAETAAVYQAIATMNHNASATGSAFVLIEFC